MVKNPPVNAGDMRLGFHPWVRKIPWRRAWKPTPIFLPRESHGQRSLRGYISRDCKESDTTEATSMPAYDHRRKNPSEFEIGVQ